MMESDYAAGYRRARREVVAAFIEHGPRWHNSEVAIQLPPVPLENPGNPDWIKPPETWPYDQEVSGR